MTNNLEDEIKSIVAGMDNQEHQQSQEEIQDIYIFVVRENQEVEDTAQVIDSEPAPVTPQLQKILFLPAYAICLFYLFLIFSCIAFQVYEILNLPIATITVIPKSQQLTLNGTLQMGRLLNPITISQSQTTATTGKGHQDAKNASGYVTFYNGQMNSIFIPAGLLLTGSDGVQIVTDQDASIPASNLPQVGQVTVQAHATSPGSKGNIAAYDINQGCCATAIKAVNTNSFYNGQDERNFQTVSKNDIDRAASPLKATLAQSMIGALEGQVKPSEHLSILPCSPTVTPNRNVEDEATTLKVIVSLTCSAVAYNTTELENKATALLTTKAQSKFSGYNLFGDIQIKVNQASVSRTNTTTVFLTISATGKWIYGLSRQSQQHIKELLAGKTKDQALQILAAMPGIERGSISFTGFIDDTRLPKDSRHLHIILIVM